MGVPFYGQSFSLVDNVGTGLGVPTYAGGEAGDETRARGFLSFYEVSYTISNTNNKKVRHSEGESFLVFLSAIKTEQTYYICKY